VLLAWVLLVSGYLPAVSPLIDQICVGVGYENMRNASHHTLFKKDGGGAYKPVHEVTGGNNLLCRALFRMIYHSPAVESNAAIGGTKYRAEWMGPATLSFNRPALGIDYGT